MDEIFISFNGSVRENAIKLAEKIEKVLHYSVFVDKKRGKELQEYDAKHVLKDRIFAARKVILYLTKEYIQNLPYKDYLQIELQAIKDRIKKDGESFFIIIKDSPETKLKDDIINDDVYEFFDDFIKEEKLFHYLRRTDLFDIESIKKRIKKDIENIGERYLPFINEKVESINIYTLEKQLNYLNFVTLSSDLYNNEKFANYLEFFNVKNEFYKAIDNFDFELLNNILNKFYEEKLNLISGLNDSRLYTATQKDIKTSLKNITNIIDEFEKLIDELQHIYKFKDRKVLLTGEALIGKTHFLSDLALKRINCYKPTLLFYGENLKSPTLIQSLKDNLELSHLSDEEFFNEIDLWGKDLNERVFIIIDGINETPDLNLWRNELTKLCSFVKEHENIALILSVRDIEKEKIVSDKNRYCIESELVEIIHPGFEGVETEALIKYCKAFGVDLPKIPFHIGKIFINPGMLYIFIKAIKELEIKYEFNHINPLKIFELYKKSLEKKFANKFDEDEDMESVEEGINEIIKLGLNLETFEFEINYKEAGKKLKPIHNKLLAFLVSEGVFRKIKRDEKTYIKFTYQKFENFYIVNHILENKPELIDKIIKTHNFMLIEALITLYPQKFNKELYEEYPDILEWYFDLYKRSFYFRDPNSITEKFLEDIRKVDYESYVEFLIYFSIYPNHKFNNLLHQKLLEFELAVRDYAWTIAINNIFLEENNLIRQIINWTIENDVPDESRYFYGRLLSWFLTSTNRELRDKATKALVNLYTNHLCEFLKLLKKFEHVNDLYILERLYATLYGIILRSEKDCFKEVAEYIYKTIFDKDFVIEHVLIREYASLAIKHILNFLDSDFINLKKINPPYNQHIDWTLPNISKEEVDKYEEEYKSIHFSTLHWDFKKYIIYPTFDDFFDLKIKNRPHNKIFNVFTKKKQRYKKFFESLNKDQLQLYEEVEKNNPILAILLEKDYDKNIENQFINSLNESQKKEYLEFIKNYDYKINLPKINLKNVKRFIFLEAIKLGWKKEYFENYEKYLNHTDRHNKKIERIGKKYQWIAYYKTIAKVSDNYEIKDERDWNKIGKFKGAYQFGFVRNIDPSTILVKKPEFNDKNECNEKIQKDFINNNWQCLDLSHEEWLKSDKNLPPIKQFIDLDKELNLATAFSIDSDKNEETYRNLYYHIDSFLIEKDKLLDFVKWLKNYRFYGRDKLPNTADIYQIFLREYPKSEVFEYFNQESSSYFNWTDEYERIKLPAKILLTATYTYIQESGGYDKSIDESITVMLPNKWIIKKMNLKQSLTDGEWINNENKAIIYDPTIKKGNKFNQEYRSLLAQKKEFLEFLDKENLSIIWIMWGEKQIRQKDWHRSGKVYEIGEICGYGYFDNGNFIEEKWICNK